MRAPRRAGVLAPVAFRLAARRAVDRLAPDVTVSFGFDCPSADVLVVGSVHGAWVESGRAVSFGRWRVPGGFRRVLPRHQVRLLLERLSLRRHRPPTLIAVSQRVADDLTRLYGCPPGAIRVVPNGFDPAQCSPARAARLRPAARHAGGLTDTDTALVMVANEWHRKGLGVLIDALALLAEPKPVLVLVGRTAPTHYAARIAAAGLEDHVRYLGALEDVAGAYAAGDLFVLPTQYEPFGTVIVEALACGLPVVTTALAGASGTVHPGVNGLLQQDPDDATELAALLARALEGDTLAGWSAAAPGAVEGYEWDNVMALLEAAIFASAVVHG